MASRLTTDRPSHLLTDDVVAEVLRKYGNSGPEISDASALTIASWWQSPGGTGRHFAELASTGSVDVHDLIDAIGDVYGEADTMDKRALDCLATWALNHPSRTAD